MKFSIIIAAYNLGHLVEEAIDSCVAQQSILIDDYEIIVIDDGSTDQTGVFIDKYASVPNIRIVHKANAGLSATRNLGIRMAKGEFIVLLDGDDWLTKDALATLSPYLEGNDVVAFPMNYYYDEHKQHIKLHGLQTQKYSQTDFLRITLGNGQFNIIPAQKKIYRKTFLQSHKIEFVEGILHEDNPFFIDVMSHLKEIVFVDKPIYNYRQNREGSITAQCTIRNFDGVIKGVQHIEQTSLAANRDVVYLNASMYVFQAIGNYRGAADRAKVYAYLRSWSVKMKLLKYLFQGRFVVKHIIRLLLLIVDPQLLRKVVKML